MLLRRSYLYILLFTCLLTACVGDVKEKDSFSAHNSIPSLDQVISPIDKSAFYFIEIVDFLAQDTILLNRQTEAFFELVIRNLFTGKEEIFYRTAHPIIMATPNPDNSKIMVQESINETSARLSVINLKGELLWEKDYVGTEVQWYWNPYRMNEVYVQSFAQDWSFETERVQLDQNFSENISFEYPFFQWIHADEIIYLDWDPEILQQMTNLVKKNLQTDETEILAQNAYAFSVQDGVLIIFSVVEKEKPYAQITVLQLDGTTVFSYHEPLQNSFSENLLVPQFAYSAFQNGLLFYLTDESEEGFQLYFGSDEKLEKLDQPYKGMLPICTYAKSPYILVGYQKEWIYNMNTKQWYSMYQE